MTRSKRYQDIRKKVDVTKAYSLEEALNLLQECPRVKFDESVELSLKIGIDPKKSDQQVRGTVALPRGTGKTLKVVVIAKGDKIQDAKSAGADEVGAEELVEKIKNGWTDFDALITTPDMMREVGKLGKVLGPRGLMPTPKAGTVTTDIKKAVDELKAGKVEFKVDKSSVINNMVGKVSFDKKALKENIDAFLAAVQRAKPSTAKGQYLKSMFLSTTMGPGLRIDMSTIG
ncbi:MAG: 50S ribosomal protein L1 [Alphaproteobacteria bacterium]|jgi:large subunit ribosomal protein L1|nr:50S ribosomal protein L1 [Alphaproteobacteria bacterium]